MADVRQKAYIVRSFIIDQRPSILLLFALLRGCLGSLPFSIKSKNNLIQIDIGTNIITTYFTIVIQKLLGIKI
jgi:hypothetical protein